MNPGRSADTMTCLPSSRGEARGSPPRSSSAVALPRISSISGITGTGLKKCIPTNRARRGSRDGRRERVDRDRGRVRGEDRAGRGDPRRARPTARALTAGSSNTASTTRSASAAAAEVVGGDERARGSRRAPPAWSLPFATARSRLPAIRSRPASARARSGSYRTTCLPIAAWTWAMPWPIRPGARDEDALDAHPVLLGVVATGYPAGCGATTSRDRVARRIAAPRTATTDDARKIAG